MVRRRLRRGDRDTGCHSPPRRTRRELEDLQAIALIAFALFAVAGVFVYVLAGGFLQFLTPGTGEPVSAASVGPASATPASAAPASTPTPAGSVGAPSPTVPTPTAAGSADPPPTAAASPTARSDGGEVLVVEEFRLTPMGPFSDPAWRTSPPEAGLSIVAVPTSVDRSLRVETTPGGGPVVACRALDPTGARFTVETTWRVDGGQAAGPLLSIGDRRAAVLVGRDDGARLTFADGRTTSPADMRIQSGEWYRLVVDVDVDLGTYAVEAEALGRDAGRVRRADLALGRSSPEADGVCFVAAGAADASISVDEVRITAR